MLKKYRAAFIGSDMSDIKKLQRHISNLMITEALDSMPVSDYAQVFARDDIDVIIVSKAPAAPMVFLLQALQSQKPVFFEDCYFSLAELESIKKIIAHQVCSSIQIGFPHRFDPHLAHLQQEIKKNVLGKLYLLKSVQHFAKGEKEQALLRALDGVQFISDQPIKELFSMHGKETTVISLRLQNDTLAVIDLNQQTHYGLINASVLGKNVRC